MRIKLNYHLILITQLPHCFVPCKHNSVVFYTHIQNILRRWNMTIKDTVTLCLHWKWHKPKFSNSVNEVTYCISGCVHKRSVFTCYLTYQHGLWDQKFVSMRSKPFSLFILFIHFEAFCELRVSEKGICTEIIVSFSLSDSVTHCLFAFTVSAVLPWQQFDMMG